MSQKRREPARQSGHRRPRRVGFWYRFGHWLGLSAQDRLVVARPSPPEASITPKAPPADPPAVVIESSVSAALAVLTQRYQAALLSNPPRPPIPQRA